MACDMALVMKELIVEGSTKITGCSRADCNPTLIKCCPWYRYLKGLEHRILGWKQLILKYHLDMSLSKEM